MRYPAGIPALYTYVDVARGLSRGPGFSDLPLGVIVAALRLYAVRAGTAHPEDDRLFYAHEISPPNREAFRAEVRNLIAIVEREAARAMRWEIERPGTGPSDTELVRNARNAGLVEILNIITELAREEAAPDPQTSITFHHRSLSDAFMRAMGRDPSGEQAAAEKDASGPVPEDIPPQTSVSDVNSQPQPMSDPVELANDGHSHMTLWELSDGRDGAYVPGTYTAEVPASVDEQVMAMLDAAMAAVSSEARPGEPDATPGDELSPEECEQLAWEAASTINHTLARVFVQLGPPPEDAGGDLSPVTSGDGGAQQ